MTGKDYYKILQVHPEAGEEVIKRAYKVLAIRYHPDKHKSDRGKWAAEKFKDLSEAYRVLSDPVKRREYDRRDYSEQSAEKSGSSGARADEEAYFYYRMGLDHYKKSQKKSGRRILQGRVELDLKKARDDFTTVLSEYPNSKYSEDAHFYYIRTLMESHEYGTDFLKDTEEEFDRFLDEYPRGRWAGEVRLLQARFFLFKKRDRVGVIEKLNDFISLYPDGDHAEEAKILLKHARGLRKKPSSQGEEKDG